MTASSSAADAPGAAPSPGGTTPRRRDEILGAAAGLFASQGYRSTSMREVAAAAGILAGSLYHHFPSKEAIAVELVEEYHAELAGIVLASTVRDSGEAGLDPVAALRAFAREVSAATSRHRAAHQITMYDAPTTAGPALKAVLRAEPAELDRCWRDLIAAAVSAAAIDPAVDADILRHVLRATSLQADGAGVADCTTSIIFGGLAASPAGVLAADGESAAMQAVGAARARWAAQAAARREERRGVLLDIARAQFALRGFEATTIRDIADAAGLPAGNLYRYFESKDALITEILSGFSDRLLDAYRAVLAAGDPAVESLEALCWLLDQAGRHFSAEIDMLKGNGKVLSLPVAAHYRDGAQSRYTMLVRLIKAGVATGELRDLADPALVASCVREVMWAPMRQLAAVPPARVRQFVRRCVLAGAALQ